MPSPRRAITTPLKTWVAAGAKDDSALVKAVLPDIKPRVPPAAPVAALAYRPDGKSLIAGGYAEAVEISVAGHVAAMRAGFGGHAVKKAE